MPCQDHRERRHTRTCFLAALVLVATSTAAFGLAPPRRVQDPVVPYAVTYDNPASLDEDDMCFWVHPTDPSLSTVIVTDKFAGLVFVYDLQGNLLQSLPSPSPRNVDTRYGVQFDGTCIDIVAFNDRTEDIIRVYRVDPATRFLHRIDDGMIATDDNYGSTLYRHTDGTLYFYTGHRNTFLMRGFRLFENGLGQMSGGPSGWEFQETRVEGIVADDETGYLYLGEENVGIWRVHALDDSDRTLIATINDPSGLEGDVEGLSIYYAANGEGYIIASSQGGSKFTVLERQPPHVGAGNFQVEGVRLTDGIDVLNMSLNGTFSQGIFTVHNGGSNCCSVHGIKWEDIANALGLIIDTDYWDPRLPCVPFQDFVRFEQAESGSAEGSATVATAQDLVAVSDDLYLAAIATKPAEGVDAVSGLGLSWTRVRSQCSGRGNTAVEVWAARGNPGGNGPVTASLAGAQSAAVIAVNRFSNVASGPIQNVLSGNTNGLSGTCSGGVDSDTYSFPLTTTMRGAFVYSAIAARNRSHTPAIGARERAELMVGTASGGAGVAVQDLMVTRPGTVDVTGTLSGPVDWAMVGLEILPRVSAPLVQTFLPTDDAPVNSSNPSSNYGDLDTLRVRYGTPEYDSFLKFQVTGLNGAPQSATLRLFATDGSNDGGSLYVVSDNWDEGQITAANAPAITGTPVASAGAVAAGNWVELDVTSAVTANGVQSFGLATSSTNSAFYSSKEGTQPPELVITSASLASATVRNGTGVNPLILTSLNDPVLGSSWNADLDCSGQASGFAALVLYSGPATGPTIKAGELLVDLTSARLYRGVLLTFGAVSSFAVPITNNLALLGVTATAQGLCYENSFRLSNAIDLTLGR